MKKLLLGLLLVPSLGFCGNLTLGGAGTGSLVITAPTTGTSVSVYPATATASFPFGVSASTISVSSNTIIPGSTFYANSFELRSSSIVFTPSTIGIWGTPTNDNAQGGYIGEYLSSTTASASNCAATGNYFDIGSLTLTPGDWDVSALIAWLNNGAVATQFSMGIGTVAGNSSTGLADGDMFGYQGQTSATNGVSVAIPAVRKSVAVTTTVYEKVQCNFSAGTPRVNGSRISARRVR